MNVMTDQNTGSSSEFKYVYGTKPFNIFATGVFDTATLTLEAQAPNGDWIPVKDGNNAVTFTESNMVSVSDKFPFKGRFTISGEGLDTSISVSVVGQVLV